MGGHSLLQGIFLTQGSNLGLLHCRQIFLPLSPLGSPILCIQMFKRLSIASHFLVAVLCCVLLSFTPDITKIAQMIQHFYKTATSRRFFILYLDVLVLCKCCLSEKFFFLIVKNLSYNDSDLFMFLSPTTFFANNLFRGSPCCLFSCIWNCWQQNPMLSISEFRSLLM